MLKGNEYQTSMTLTPYIKGRYSLIEIVRFVLVNYVCKISKLLSDTPAMDSFEIFWEYRGNITRLACATHFLLSNVVVGF